VGRGLRRIAAGALAVCAGVVVLGLLIYGAVGLLQLLRDVLP
jgi:hypothetical protein